MTRDEIKAELEVLGVKYNKYASKEALEKRLAEVKEGLKDEPKNTETVLNPSDGIQTQGEAKGEPQESIAAEPEMGVKPPEYTDEELKNIAESISGKSKLTVEKAFNLAGVHKTLGGDTKTESGVIIPPHVLAQVTSTKFVYYAEDTMDKSVVNRMSNRRTECVRTYSKDDHGEGFRELANQFIKKKNTQ